MNFRTDLAIERREVSPHPDDGVRVEEFSKDGVKITRIEVLNATGERELQKPKGNYITIETSAISAQSVIDPAHLSALTQEITRLLPKSGTVLICGIGNTEITPDALGPKTAELILATRHISAELAKSAGLGALRAVAAVSPGVLGQTGMETGELLCGIIEKIKPEAVIAVDALASRRLSRLGRTIQLADTGIIPGSGVGNSRRELSRRTLGIPVISIGVPTVVDAQTLVRDLTGGENDISTSSDSESKVGGSNNGSEGAASMIVTPKEIDLLCTRAARLIAHAINCALQPHLDPDDLLLLTS